MDTDENIEIIQPDPLEQIGHTLPYTEGVSVVADVDNRRDHHEKTLDGMILRCPGVLLSAGGQTFCRLTLSEAVHLMEEIRVTMSEYPNRNMKPLELRKQLGET